MKKSKEIDALWLAQSLIQALEHNVSVDDFLHHAKANLPSSYQPVLEKMTASWHANKSLPPVLKALNNDQVNILANLLELNQEKVELVLQRWYEGSQQLTRVKLLLKEIVKSRLVYIATVMGVWWISFSCFLLYVVPGYVEWYGIGFGDSFIDLMPSVTRFMVDLADGKSWLIFPRTLIYFTGPLAFTYLLLANKRAKQLSSISTKNKKTILFPWLNPYYSLTMLYELSIGVKHKLESVKSITTEEQYANLELADKFNYLPEEASRLFNLPESYWSQQVASRFHKMVNIVTVMLWLLVASFVFAVYQPIFQLGTTS